MKNISEQTHEALKIWLDTKVVSEGYTESELVDAYFDFIDYYDYCIWEPLYLLEEQNK